MASCSEIKTRLDEAQAAYDRLVRGELVVLVWDSDRSRVQYTAADRSALFAYIQRLTVEYAKCAGQPVIALTKPIQFVF